MEKFLAQHSENGSNGTDKKSPQSMVDKFKFENIQGTGRKLSLRARARMSHAKLSKSMDIRNPIELDVKDELLIEDEELEAEMLGLCLYELAEPLNSHVAQEICRLVEQQLKTRKGKENYLQHLRPVISTLMRAVDSPRVVNETWYFALHSMAECGKRSSMEDRHLMLSHLGDILNMQNAPDVLCGVFDGHGGPLAAEYTRNHLWNNILRHPSFHDDIAKAIKEGFFKTDDNWCSKATMIGDKSGTTATISFICQGVLFTANVGDSAAYLACGKDADPIQLTEEHKASLESEKVRVKEAGGIVVWYGGGWRVNGSLAVSRSIGDSHLDNNNILVPDPYIHQHTLTENDDFVILASDGLWDVFKPKEAVDFVYEWMEQTERSLNVCQALIKAALEKETSDNVSVVVIFLKDSKGEGPRPDQSDW